ncbi:uncharacterized protein LOC113360580 [Papaver somniferum]|uniref:uncharacterized protein LOC113360580 n=1 Tax=Papaver somniferum TaxID=3469 RepID=UPI000E705B6A|nr:uncharacterized protein LOC113360580 [Papaver somniferum]
MIRFKSTLLIKQFHMLIKLRGKNLTFVERVVGNKRHVKTTVDLNSLPNPTTKEGKPAVEIPQDLFIEGCEIWKYSLIGHIEFKGSDFNSIKISLEQQWKLGQGRVQFVPLNRGFFIIKLLSQEDKDEAFSEDVWVRFPGLPLELWVEKSLLAMGKSLGNPIVVDSKSLNHEYGHFVVVLIDIDFSKHDNTDAIHVTAGGRDFWQNIDIPKHPKFCSKCNIIGHMDVDCRKKKHTTQQAKGPPKQQWRQFTTVENTSSTILADELQHSESELVGLSEEDRIALELAKVISECKAKVDQGEEISVEERATLELAQKMEEDLAKLQRARMERAAQAYSRKLDSSGVILSPNKFSVLPDEACLHESKEDTENQFKLDFVCEKEFERLTDSDCSDQKLGLEAQPEVSSIKLTKEEHEIFCTITKFYTQQKYLKDLSFRKEYVKETIDQSKRMRTPKKKAKGDGNTKSHSMGENVCYNTVALLKVKKN